MVLCQDAKEGLKETMEALGSGTLIDQGAWACLLGPLEASLGGKALLLSGPLGSGKTTLAQALASHMGYLGRVSSPSFGLMHPYPLPKPLGDISQIHHFDFYRKDPLSPEDLITLDFLDDSALRLVEWPERLMAPQVFSFFPDFFLWIHLAPLTGHPSSEKRKVSLWGRLPSGDNCRSVLEPFVLKLLPPQKLAYPWEEE